MRLAAAAACLSTIAALVALASRMRPSASELLLLGRGEVLAATPGAGHAAFRVPRRAPVLSAGWLGEHWYIDGLEDDGRYMVPATPDADSSGNALFDFGPEGGLPLSKTTGEPVKGHLPDHRFRRTGTSEEHFPNEIYQFDIDGIRRDEDGYVPWWDRYRGFYSNTYPQYTQDYGFVEAPAVSVEDGHVTDIDDNQVRDLRLPFLCCDPARTTYISCLCANTVSVLSAGRWRESIGFLRWLHVLVRIWL